ncbi:glycosyltransferase [Photobacterium swingsii]|uniref:glycosyltransferase n=1 Tax=Photobacterium swingsii TaxID=680026 RepID=UPI003D0A1426
MIRIKGLLTSIKASGESCLFLNNTSSHEDGFEFVDLKFSSFEKKAFQFMLPLFPVFIVNMVFLFKYKALRNIARKYQLFDKDVIFCEYLDISIGYFMKENKLIKDYICDIHGIVPVEFKGKKTNVIYNRLRYKIAVKLDTLVFSNASGVIYASEALKSYMEVEYPSISDKKYMILPYLISNTPKNVSSNDVKVLEIKDKYNISDDDFVILFAGSYKSIGGVFDLVRAYHLISNKKNRLILIGNGEDKSKVLEYINKNNISESVVLIDRIDYSDLPIYQSLSSVIVCPDRMNIYSNLIVHLKYIDSLSSNKVVINGSFDSVLEFNHKDSLSLSFSPSDVADLADKIKYVIDNYDFLCDKYSNNKSYVDDNLTYYNYPFSI